MLLGKSRRILLRQIVPDATHDVSVLMEAVNLLANEVGSGCGAIALPRYQYGGGLRRRCAFAASTHHMRSSAKRGNARSSAWPASPTGSPSVDKVCPMGPTAIVLETTTIPISESVPCQAVAARAPDKRPPE